MRMVILISGLQTGDVEGCSEWDVLYKSFLNGCVVEEFSEWVYC